jgi:hypothetical protein
MRRPYPPNNFCPCKSGQKYKKCCQAKGIEYFIRPNGQVVKEAVLDSDGRAEFLRQKEAFVAEHGRQPTEEEEGILRMSGGFADFSQVIEADLIKSGAKEEVLYAFRKTGILVTRENESQVTPEELRRWESALLEYRRSNS